MAFTTVDKPSAHFDTKIYAGSSSAVSVSGIGFKPDVVITKDRTEAHAFGVYDSNRGIKKWLKWDSAQSQNNAQDVTNTIDASLTSFNSDGFTIAVMSSDPIGNKNGNQFVSWMWKMNGGTTTSNGAGSNGASIASVYQANTTAGQSIVTYDGTGTAGTIKHGLSVTPKLIMIKNLVEGREWQVGHFGTTHISDPETDGLLLTASPVADESTYFNDTAPTSTVFSVGTHLQANTADSSSKYVAYCFAETKGYSKIGTYTGTGNANGAFAFCGFRPRMVFLTRYSGGNAHWVIKDSARTETVKDGSAGRGPRANPTEQGLYPSNGIAENTNAPDMDFYANGFKLRDTDGDTNTADVIYIYYAVADVPLVGTNGTIALAQ